MKKFKHQLLDMACLRKMFFLSHFCNIAARINSEMIKMFHLISPDIYQYVNTNINQLKVWHFFIYLSLSSFSHVFLLILKQNKQKKKDIDYHRFKKKTKTKNFSQLSTINKISKNDHGKIFSSIFISFVFFVKHFAYSIFKSFLMQ